MTVVLVGMGGLAGVVARYGLSMWVQSIWTVAAINLAGSFLLGLVTSARFGLPVEVRTGLGVGFIGGVTTFSTVTTQTVLEADGGRPGLAAAYLAVNVVGGLAAATLGYGVGRTVT